MKENRNLRNLRKGLIIMAFLGLFLSSAFGQEFVVSGTVSDGEGFPLPGVTIVKAGTTEGTITDAEGQYSINVSGDETLVFSFIGMRTVRVPVNGQRTINVTLEQEYVDLEQVVVTGYSSQRRSDITGAVSVVEVDDMMKTPDSNPIKALQGRIPGVRITSDGSPKGNASINIRGINSLRADNNPLYIIDGVPTQAGMHELNSNDIESIQVLKDASAASIYGSRAANGVIVITTKKAKEGKTVVEFDAYLSSSYYNNKIDVLNTEQYGKAMWQAYVNRGAEPNTNNMGYEYDWGYDGNGNPELNKILLPAYLDAAQTMRPADTDWFSEVTRPALMQSYNLSLSNGTEKGNYFFSVGYLDNEGIIKHSNFSRVSTRMNSEYKLWDDKLTIGENFTLNMTQELEANAGAAIDQAIQALPVIPVYTEDGGWGGPTGGMNDRDNPLRVLDANKDNSYRYWRTFGNGYANLEPIEGLNIKTSFGLDYGNFYKRSFTRSYQAGFLKNDRTAVDMQQGHWLKWTWTNTATYNLQTGNHNVDFLAGTEMFREENIDFNATKEGFDVETTDFMWPNTGTGDARTTGGSIGYSLLSYFGRADYSYDNRYMASATVRYDGSSRFGENNRFGFFPAFSLGWRISQEAFMDNADFVSDLKLRASWGQTGNQSYDGYYGTLTSFVPDYGIADPTWSIIRGTAYDIEGKGSGQLPSGFKREQIGNPDLKWETTTQSNIGVDFGFLRQTIYGTIEVYQKETEDMLVTPPYIAVIGEGGSQTFNGASMKNTGLDVSLGYRGEMSNGLSYDISGNISAYKNEITELPEYVWNAYSTGEQGGNILGRPIGSMFGYVTDGLFRTQEEVDSHAVQDGKGLGRIRYKDLSEDGFITEEDRAWIGDPHPDFTYGLNINLEYRQFDLSLFAEGVHNVDLNVHAMKTFTDFWSVRETGSNKGTRLLNAWSPSNPDSDIPALQSTNINNEGRFSTYFVENGSYLKLRNAQFGYTLPESISSRIRMQRFRVYVSGQNLFTIASKDFTGVDPENTGFGYPKPISFTFGINATF